MKYYTLALLVVWSQITLLAQTLQFFNVAEKQIKCLNVSKNLDSVATRKLYLDSLYFPYQQFWSGYIGDEDSFVQWMMTDARHFETYLNERFQAVDGTQLLKYYNLIQDSLHLLSGYKAVGTWYIIFGPGWTDLGSLGTGEMLIDLSHENNHSAEQIMQILPHELTHQIMDNVNKHTDTTALGPILGEGFAVYVNELYWQNKYTTAHNLGYSEDELLACREYATIIQDYFKKHKFSTNPEVINTFRNRGIKIDDHLPGAIGYYIGYEIIKKYVSRHGPQSWKDVFIKSTQDIYTLSGY